MRPSCDDIRRRRHYRGTVNDAPSRRWPTGIRAAGPIILIVIQVGGTFGAAHNQPNARWPDALAVAIAAAGPLALYGLGRRPREVLAFITVITFGYVAAGYPYGPVFASFVAATVTNVARGHRVAAWIAVAGALVLSLAARFAVLDAGWSWGWLAGTSAWAMLVIAAGELVRINRARVAATRAAEAEERRREAGEERLRIARELHDVVAHHMSLIHVQAGVALHLVDRRPEQAQTALTTIRDASSEALAELRSLIGVLRAAGEQAPLAPTASLDALDELAARASQAGVTTTVDVRGDVGRVPATVAATAIRIIQEGVTNVVRHSRATRARLSVEIDDDALTIRLTDNGRGPGSSPGAGSGLRGMRERAAAHGGEVSLTAAESGGAVLRAVLPMEVLR